MHICSGLSLGSCVQLDPHLTNSNKSFHRIHYMVPLTQNFSDLCTGLHASRPLFTSAVYSSNELYNKKRHRKVCLAIIKHPSPSTTPLQINDWHISVYRISHLVVHVNRLPYTTDNSTHLCMYVSYCCLLKACTLSAICTIPYGL